MFEGLVFDLDGTLLDSGKAARSAFFEAYRRCGLKGAAPVEAFMSMSGTPLNDVVERLGLPSGFSEAYDEAAWRNLGEVEVFPGVRELLDSISELGILMTILTGKERTRTQATLEAVGIEGFFVGIVTPDDPPKPKPSPEGVVRLCEIMDVNVTDVAVIGDSLLDLRAGKSAGAVVIACTWGAVQREELASEEPHYLVDTVQELMDLIVSDLIL